MFLGFTLSRTVKMASEQVSPAIEAVIQQVDAVQLDSSADRAAPARRNYVLDPYREYPERREGEAYPVGVIGPVEFFEDVECTVPCAADKYAAPLCSFDGERFNFAADAYPEDVLFVFATLRNLKNEYHDECEYREAAVIIALVACELQRKSLNPEWTGTELTDEDVKYLKMHLENPKNLPRFVGEHDTPIVSDGKPRVGAMNLPVGTSGPGYKENAIVVNADGSWSICRTFGLEDFALIAIKSYLPKDYPNAIAISALAGFANYVGYQSDEMFEQEYADELHALHRLEFSFDHIFRITGGCSPNWYGAIDYYSPAPDAGEKSETESE
jgi:hypothetical protein